MKYYEEAYKQLADVLERRHDFFVMLENYKKKYKILPVQYKSSYKIFELENKEHWSKNPRVTRRLKKAAKKLAADYEKNERRIKKDNSYLNTFLQKEGLK
jgi:hypothetical protein